MIFRLDEGRRNCVHVFIEPLGPLMVNVIIALIFVDVIYSFFGYNRQGFGPSTVILRGTFHGAC